MAGTVTVTGSDTGAPAGARTLGPLAITGTTALGATTVEGLSSGDNTIQIPAGAVGAVIIPPAGGTATLKLRSNLNNADGGLPISPTQPTVYVFPTTAPTSLIINASSTQAALMDVWFW